MSTYLFVLGKHRNLSLAELVARYPKATFEAIGPDFAVMNIDKIIDQKEFDQLGGVIKVAKFLSRSSNKGVSRKIVERITEEYVDKKVSYGISVYGESQKILKTLLIGLKKTLIQEGVKSRFANKDFKNIKVPQYKQLKQDGFELVLFKDQNFFWIGEVIAAQDIDAYSKRDFDKPYRDMQVGMLPPKLAQVLINLSSQNGTVWDPFCGGGVLLIEGMLMGRDVIGSDINTETLKGTQKNLEWTQKELGAKGGFDIFEHDARTPMTTHTFDAIAAEGYLGPPQNKPVTPEEAQVIIKELTPLYLDFFKSLKDTKCNKPVVLALPYFKLINRKEMDMRDLITGIEKIGFKPVAFLPNMPDIKDPYTLKYSREDQAVGREIHKFMLP